ncbi:hypothetical protein GGR53DRAFT_372607 [Hypoxylon sp. FL1150]|nr:hypothetical protein GGR53DRAFT_372607 [Hypoxylon sp. FL1150]
MCGTAIEINLNGRSQRVIIGGLIQIITFAFSELYALIARYPLASLYIESSGPSLDSSDDDSSEASDSDSDDGFLKASDNIARRLFELERFRSDAIYNVAGEKKQIGTTSISGKPIGNHDWALLKINSPYWEPNIICSSAASSESGKRKQMQTRIDNWKSQYNDAATTELYISTNSHPSRQHATIITCHGIQRGILSSNQTALFMSPSNSFVNTLDFSPLPGSDLKHGDSGAWVINESTGKMYGHVMAINGLGEAHVIGIHGTIQSIASQSAANSVHLPSHEEISIQKSYKSWLGNNVNGYFHFGLLASQPFSTPEEQDSTTEQQDSTAEQDNGNVTDSNKLSWEVISTDTGFDSGYASKSIHHSTSSITPVSWAIPIRTHRQVE